MEVTRLSSEIVATHPAFRQFAPQGSDAPNFQTNQTLKGDDAFLKVALKAPTLGDEWVMDSGHEGGKERI